MYESYCQDRHSFALTLQGVSWHWIILQNSILKAYFFNCFRFRSECLTYDSRGWYIFWHPEPLSRHSLQALFAKGGLLPRRSKARLASPKYQAGLTTNYFVPFLLATPSSLYPRPLKGFLSGLGSRTPFKDPQLCFTSGTTKDTRKLQSVSMWHTRRKKVSKTPLKPTGANQLNKICGF